MALAPDTRTDARSPRALEDPSGRRLWRMRWVGRGIALVFLLWFVVILLGALGVGPGGRLPLGNALRPSAGPPPLRRVPTPQPPPPSDLLPALPAPAVAPRVARRSPTATALTRHRPARGRSASAPGRHATATTPGRSASAPGHVATTAPGRSSTTSGHVSTHGASAPGRLRRETTTTVTTAATTTIVTTTTVPGRGRGTAKGH